MEKKCGFFYQSENSNIQVQSNITGIYLFKLFFFTARTLVHKSIPQKITLMP